jgi:hypothetical protein
MLEGLEIGEAEAVEPERLARKTEELPLAIAKAWDETPVGEAKRLAVKSNGDGANRAKVGNALLRLLAVRAKGQGYMAFKASATPTEEGLSLYWQKKPARGRKPEPAILPAPEPEVLDLMDSLKASLAASEPVKSKPKGRPVSPATDELRNE